MNKVDQILDSIDTVLMLGDIIFLCLLAAGILYALVRYVFGVC